MSDHCGITTEDGNAVCIPGECSCSRPNSNQSVILPVPTINNNKSLLTQIILKFKKTIAILDHQSEKNYVEENS